MTQNTANINFLCRYLYSSANEYEDAFTLYAGARNTDIIKSFSYIHKAWNSLWYIDMMLHQSEIIKANSEKTKTPGLHTILNYVDARETNVRGLEGYQPELASSLFRHLHKSNKKHPFVLNLQLVRKIRNLDQHAYLEPSHKKRMHLVHTLNPYLIANIRNYIEVYKSLKELVEIECNDHLKSSRCKKFSLINPAHLAADIIIPQSMLSIDNPNLENLLNTIAVYMTTEKEKVEDVSVKVSSHDSKSDEILGLLSEYETDAQIIKCVNQVEQAFVEGVFKDSNEVNFLRLNKGSYYLDEDLNTRKKKKDLQAYTGYDLTNNSQNSLLNRELVIKFFKLFKYNSPNKLIQNLNVHGYEYDLKPKDIKNIVKKIGTILGWNNTEEDNIFVYRVNGVLHYSFDLEYFIANHLKYEYQWEFFDLKSPLKKES